MELDQLSRFDRIVAMLIHLQSGRVVKAQEMAVRFGVSLRTIYRDIRSLEACGVPILGEAGLGYSLMEGYRLPPVMFTREEADSFVAAGKLMQKFSDKTLEAHYQSALYKVKSVLRGTAKDRVAALEAQVWVHADDQLFNNSLPDALSILFESIAEKKQVTLQYQNLFSEERVHRIIEPVGIFNENNFWYVYAYCLLRHDYRQFRIDRMLQLKRTETPFIKEHLNLDAYKRKKKEECPKIKVIIRVHKEAAKFIRTGLKYYGFISEKLIGDQIEMTFMTKDIQNGFPRWYLMFGDCAEIIEPESFRDRVFELLEKTRASLEASVHL